ncbi:GAF domain-containing sensor histidine kinase [Amycolatopsis mongoliensis]|uniref:GAF domain-containing sensor histidine kinase n=1 Tax=Amycolatopsis mongoliensis TaxID=715475 RepID=A0A9Y2NKN3_9PSEU|nr:GAF domain-containing sensor histidine kinase [Amycolatopsis sp. 4-36]WIY02988.1 GAF domain-containing sensor histidine kinase [Amycolatopsis sp. 4-36]
MPEETLSGRDRMDALPAAVLAFSAGLELETTLQRIVTAAAGLVGARYGALALLDEDGRTTAFAVTGVDDATRDRIGPPPDGHGLLGALVDGRAPVRLPDLGSRGYPPGHPPMRAFLGVPLLVRGAVLGRLYLGGEQPFTADDERAIVALAAAAGIAVDNARLYEESRRRQRWLEATGEISAELLGGADVHAVLRLVASRAAELTGAEDALIALPGSPGGALVVTVCAGPDAGELTGRRIPLDGSTSGAVLRDHIPRSVPNLAHGLGVDLGPAMAVRLRSGESTAGVLLAIRAPGAARFDEHELQLVSAFADQAALALRDAESQAARRELDIAVDRNRIARDLHDHVIQRLFAVGLGIEGTRRRADAPAVTGRLTQHIDQLQDVIEEIRSAIFALHVRPGAGRGLRARLRNAITDTTADSAIHTTVRLSGAFDRVPAVLAEHAEAVVREAVSNVLRHARAAEVAVTVSLDDDLVVEVSDTGVGMPQAVARSGLRNLEQRAAEAGGSLRLESPAGGGTRLVWTVAVP